VALITPALFPRPGNGQPPPARPGNTHPPRRRACARLVCTLGAFFFVVGAATAADTDTPSDTQTEVPAHPEAQAVSASVPLPSAGSGAPTFGSEAVLRACWSWQALAGSPGDRIIRHGHHRWVPPPPAPSVAAAKDELAPLPPEFRGSIRYVVPSRKSARLVALAFDLCETEWDIAGYDAGIVNYLRAHRVPATFFAGGKWMATHPDKAKQLMADPLFELGNHTWTHRNLYLAPGQDARNQILWSQAEYVRLRDELARSPCAASAGPAAMAAIPTVPKVFRFPYGVCSPESLGTVAQLGLAAIQWSVVTGDPAPRQGPPAIAAAVLRGVRPDRGSIVVAHANGRGWHTAEALPLFVPELLRRGYRFVTVSELLASGRPVAVGQCYELRPGDNARYNRPQRIRVLPREPALR
jgi:peptidoglycan/xylan/chitin deacetylase (PgdA/CDA1 family)